MSIALWPSLQQPAYAGIGSRKTPRQTLELMHELAHQLAAHGWVLRTGLAAGADQAFYHGAADHGPVELFLPWPGFESDARVASSDQQFVLQRPAAAAYELAARFHPAWSRVSAGSRHLHARNSHQILGPDLTALVRCVICWTPDGSLDGRGSRVGGTGQALRIASHYRIPVLNLARPEHAEGVRALLSCYAQAPAACPA